MGYNEELYDRYMGMSPEDIEEAHAKRRRAQRIREEKEEWEAECRRDEELIRRHEDEV